MLASKDERKESTLARQLARRNLSRETVTCSAVGMLAVGCVFLSPLQSYAKDTIQPHVCTIVMANHELQRPVPFLLVRSSSFTSTVVFMCAFPPLPGMHQYAAVCNLQRQPRREHPVCMPYVVSTFVSQPTFPPPNPDGRRTVYYPCTKRPQLEYGLCRITLKKVPGKGSRAYLLRGTCCHCLSRRTSQHPHNFLPLGLFCSLSPGTSPVLNCGSSYSLVCVFAGLDLRRRLSPCSLVSLRT